MTADIIIIKIVGHMAGCMLALFCFVAGWRVSAA